MRIIKSEVKRNLCKLYHDNSKMKEVTITTTATTSTTTAETTIIPTTSSTATITTTSKTISYEMLSIE